MTTRARPKPCDSCPYRRDVPAGIWAPDEYAKLPGYDGDITAQVDAGALGVFHCHQAPEMVCAGWAGCHDMHHNLAVRLAVLTGYLDPAVLDYETDVPLFDSGAQAAAHGMAGVEEPSMQARAKVTRLERVLARRAKK